MGIIRRIYNLHFSKDRELARRLQAVLGFVPSDMSLFKMAFYHKSTNVDKPTNGRSQNNERLEYLGDAVLGSIVAEYLFTKYPGEDEGFLTQMRSKIVKRNSLNRIGEKMGLDLLLNEFNTNTRLSRAMLGNCVEALVGSIYLELGYDRTKRYISEYLLRRYLDIHDLETYNDNFKSQLLEWCQKNGKKVDYKLISKYKQDKRDRFKIAVMIDGQKIASADDYNKKSAEQSASMKALRSFGIVIEEEDSSDDEAPQEAAE